MSNWLKAIVPAILLVALVTACSGAPAGSPTVESSAVESPIAESPIAESPTAEPTVVADAPEPEATEVVEAAPTPTAEPEMIEEAPPPSGTVPDAGMMDASAYMDVLRNLTYPGPFPDESITLVNGQATYDDDGSGEPYVRLVDSLLVTGDLDGDGTQDAVTLLEDNSSGSGQFLFLVVVRDALGNPQPTTAVMLGDRIGLKSLQVDGSSIVADLISQGAGDAACCAGTNTQQVWELVDGQLVVQSNEEMAPIAVSDLNGTSWQLVGFNGLVEPVPADTVITAQFADGQISGSAGCNTYSATISGVEDMPTGMTVGPIATTQMACPEPDMQQEARYLAALESVTYWLWGLEPGHLTLVYQTEEGSSGDLVFKPVNEAAPTADMGALPADLTAQLDTFLQWQIYSGGDPSITVAPGVVLLVDTPDGRYLQAAGVADLESGTPMQVDDILEIGSNTKSMTIVLLMQLVEQGLISLDDPLSKWLPEQAALLPNGDQITIRQMAQHTAGLWDYGDAIIGGGLADPALLTKGYTPEELVQYAAENGTPEFSPGEEGQWKYSNTGYVLLGMIIESVTGEKMVDLMQTQIFDPLGMESATLIEGVPQDGEITTHGYYIVDGEWIDTTDWNASQGWVAGAAAMTAADLATYAKALAAGEFFQNPDTLNEMLQFDPAAGFGVGGPYGLGLQDFAGDGSIWGHGGQTIGFGSLWYTDPENGLVVVGLTNSASYQSRGLVNVFNIVEGNGALPVNSTTLMPVGDFFATSWRLSQLVNPVETIETGPDDALQLLMNKDQTVSVITADCGIASGSFTVEGTGNISFDVDTSTLTCGDDTTAGQFIQYLGEAVKWHFSDDHLILDLPADAGSLVLEPDTGD
ncbi:MAG: serine hydrolase [Chloroflexota bacterium]